QRARRAPASSFSLAPPILKYSITSKTALLRLFRTRDRLVGFVPRVPLGSNPFSSMIGEFLLLVLGKVNVVVANRGKYLNQRRGRFTYRVTAMHDKGRDDDQRSLLKVVLFATDLHVH